MIQHWKTIAGVGATMIAVHVINLFTGGYLTTFGIEPREIGSAYTIATAPWLHANFAHLGSNLAAFVVLGSLVLLQGFTALEAMAPDDGLFGSDLPNLADVCLVPQMANARRFDTPLEAFPKLARIDAVLSELPAFKAAHPDAVKPAE